MILKNYTCSILCFVFMMFGFFSFAFASTSIDDEKKNDEDKINVIPILTYEYGHMDNRQYHAPGAIAVISKGNRELPVADGSNSFFFGAIYKQYLFSNARAAGYPDNYHDIEMMIEQRNDRHYFCALFESYAEKPIKGGLQSFATGPGYGYAFIQNEHFLFIFGGGLGISDFGIDLPSGKTWPVIPIPVVRILANFQWVDFFFEFINRPIFKVTIAPKEKIRMTAFVNVSHYTDINYVFFDCALWYRFFSEQHRLGDFAGVALGVKNEGKRFSLPEKETWYMFHHYSVFAKLDLSFLQLACGYIFSGDEKYRNNSNAIKLKTGNGIWVSIAGGYMF